MEQSTEVQFDFCKISVIEDRIVHTEFYSNDKFDIRQAKLLDEARFKLINGKSFYSLISLVNVFGHMTKEAQEYFSTKALCKDLIQHEILVIDSLSIRLLAKAFIKWTKPPYNIQLKKRFNEALGTLQNMRDHH